MEIDFSQAKVIHGLFSNFSFCLKNFFRVAFMPKTELNLIKKKQKRLPRLQYFLYFLNSLDQYLSKILNSVDGGT